MVFSFAKINGQLPIELACYYKMMSIAQNCLDVPILFFFALMWADFHHVNLRKAKLELKITSDSLRDALGNYVAERLLGDIVPETTADAGAPAPLISTAACVAWRERLLNMHDKISADVEGMNKVRLAVAQELPRLNPDMQVMLADSFAGTSKNIDVETQESLMAVSHGLLRLVRN
jgi:hypothetical protein